MSEKDSISLTDAPPTTLYVLIPPSALFAAHWSFFLPDMLPFNKVSKRHEESTKGRRIHVSGDRLNGFALEIVREYDVSRHRSVGTRRYAVGTTEPKHLQSPQGMASDTNTARRKDQDEGGGYVDNEPRDDFERVCIEVEAPGPSMNKASDMARGKRIRAEVKDCQWWVRQVVQELVKRDVLTSLPAQPAAEESLSPIGIVAQLPVH